MTAIPYMPLYIADYMADAAHLSTLEHGAYMLLIMTYWQRGKPLPNADDRLANVARMSSEQWSSVKRTIAEFFVDDGESWSHKRIDAELARFRDKSAKASAAGKASAERRSNVRSTPAAQTHHHTDPDTDTEKEDHSEGKPSSSAGVTITLNDSGGFEGIGAEKLASWAEAFPAVSVSDEVLRAAAWLVANPKNKKKNNERFVVNWLTKAQERAPRVAGASGSIGGAHGQKSPETRTPGAIRKQNETLQRYQSGARA